MFRRVVVSAAFLVTVMSAFSIYAADPIYYEVATVVVDTESCSTAQAEELVRMFGYARRVLETIVPIDIPDACKETGGTPVRGTDGGVVEVKEGCVDWESEYIGVDVDIYERWFGDPEKHDGGVDDHINVVKENLWKAYLYLRESVDETAIYEEGNGYPHTPDLDGSYVAFECDGDWEEWSFGTGYRDAALQYLETIHPRWFDDDVPMYGDNYSNWNVGALSSKVGVLIHELTHRAGSTDDIGVGFDVCEHENDPIPGDNDRAKCYWYKECLDLADSYPAEAILNAENYEKFTGDVFLNAMAAQFVASTHPLMH